MSSQKNVFKMSAIEKNMLNSTKRSTGIFSNSLKIINKLAFPINVA